MEEYLIARANQNHVIDGGFLQFGTPNTFSAGALLGEAAFNAIIVMPAYRLGVFGFLYSSELEHDAATVSEPVGNQGFWDQRLALEWTRDNISLFGGNPSQITISGYSAGKQPSKLPQYTKEPYILTRNPTKRCLLRFLPIILRYPPPRGSINH